MTPERILTVFKQRQRVILLISLILCILIVIVYLLFTRNNSDSNEKVSIAPVSATESFDTQRVFIKGFDTYSDYFSSQKQKTIENALYAYVSQGMPDLFTGVIRPNSFTQTNNSDGTTSVNFLVDVSPANVTYILGITEGNRDGTALIRCAPSDQQLDPLVSCIDGMSENE